MLYRRSNIFQVLEHANALVGLGWGMEGWEWVLWG